MTIVYTDRALDAVADAPPSVQKAFVKQMVLLSGNLSHPSLRAKKYNAADDLWQGRVNRSWRFYFSIQDDVVLIHDVVPHPK
jgi:mRNA-degrading endonuclease RelE of RelBE toxin-antitoxin system